MKKSSLLLAVAAFLAAAPLHAEVANIKVVTDANPDYSDMESMVRSITGRWEKDAQKMWALYYWDHIARRQTNPIIVHGFALADPIRQYNDYGYTMCSTISGIKCSTWNYMGYPCRYFDIGLHTVPDVWYEGKFHHYDNSLSCIYTLPDGKTIASVEDIGKTMAGPETGGKPVAGYIGMYHALNGTGPDGFLQGADTQRSLRHLAQESFMPSILKYRYYTYDQDRGHRYSLNLRDGEVYTRFYSRQDMDSANAIVLDDKQPDYKADPAYFIPNGKTGSGKPADPEMVNPRYHIRGNGERVYAPILDAAHLLESVQNASNIKAVNPGLQPAIAGQPAVAVFKVEGANVITSLKIHAAAIAASSADSASIAISTSNGLVWKDVWKTGKPGENAADVKLIDEVSGAYEVLVKVTLIAAAKPQDAQLKSIAFDTITEINAHTQPTLHLGANKVYVGNGEQTGSIVFWPELQQKKYKPYVVEEKNIASDDENPGYYGTFHQADGGAAGYAVFKIDAPQDVTSINYGARMHNRAAKGVIEYAHSFDGGKTWKTDYTDTDHNAPWDTIHYEQINDVPAGTRSVLFKYSLNAGYPAGTKNDDLATGCSLFAVRMEVDHKLAGPSNEPVEVTFNWSERQKDYSTIKRSHTQLVEKLPATYTIDVGGFDQPIVDSLTINLKGSRPDVKYGYSDGKDVGGEKFVGMWADYGRDLALGKPYTLSVPSDTQWEAGDPDLKKLTDGRVGSSFTGGPAYQEGAIWKPNTNPEITVDLGQTEKCAAFRIHTLGYEFYDAIKGENKDQVEVLTSADGKEFKSAGNFDFNLRWKDIPVNFMYPDDETFTAYNFTLPLAVPVEARFVKYKLSSPRFMGVTEVQVLDSYSFTPFDLRIALPDPKENGKAPPKADVSPNAKTWREGEKPTTIGKELIPGT